MQEIGEGVTSRIYMISPTIVKKIIKRNKSKTAQQQYKIQKIASEMQFRFLYIPKVYEYGQNWYTMEYINTDNQIYKCEEELAFCEEIKKAGYKAYDYEMYVQADGRIALIDFSEFTQNM